LSRDFYISFIEPYSPIIIKICRAYTDTEQDFEDYYQEVCLQIWRSRDSFHEHAKWSTWIYRLSLNVCLTLLKKEKNNKDKHLAYNPTEHLADSNAFENEDLNLLYSAIKKLKEIDRAVILLYLEEKSYQEIADILGTKPNNIGVRINRIKDKLKKILNG